MMFTNGHVFPLCGLVNMQVLIAPISSDYEASFKTKCHRCFRNLYRTSNIYIGHPIYISDVQYIYLMSDIYIRHLGTYIRHPGTYIRHPGTYIRHPGTYTRHPGTYIRRPISISDVRYAIPNSARARARVSARDRAGISDVGYRYRTSDIYIGRPI